MYPKEIVEPCREELTNNGFLSLETPEDVEKFLNNKTGTALVVINSVCGYAARGARPAAIKSLDNNNKPARLATVFAGVDNEAVSKAREFFAPYPPSSPSIALFKDGALIHFVERHQIEGVSDDVLAEHLKAVYDDELSKVSA